MLYIDITRLYNNLRLGKTATGVDKVSLAYIDHYQHEACAVLRLPKQWLFFPEKKSQQLFSNLLNNQLPKAPTLLEKRRYKSPAKDKKNYLLNTSHSGLEHASYQEIMQLHDLHGLYFLHDLIPIDYPEYCRAGEYDKHYQRIVTMISGELIIANSAYTKARLAAFCCKHNFEAPKTIWAHLGVDTLVPALPVNPNAKNQDTLARYNLIDIPYFVILGTIEGRKNHLFLLDLWRVLVRELGTKCPKLVIIGKRGWECEQVLAILDRSVALRSVIIELNDCSDLEVNSLVSGSNALLFPSWVEGFGLPLLEAFRDKVPVIANNIDVFQEINLGGAILCSVEDMQAWKKLILQYTFDEQQVRERQIAFIKQNQFQLPSWEQHFGKIGPIVNPLLN